MVERPPDHGPVLVTVEYSIDPGARRANSPAPCERCVDSAAGDGAIRWGLFEDAEKPGRYIETFVVESWAEHLRQHERMTVSDRELEVTAFAFHLGAEPPRVTHWIAAHE